MSDSLHRHRQRCDCNIRGADGSGSGIIMEPVNNRVLNERLSSEYYGIDAPCPEQRGFLE
ncbi:MAG TPA: hypothetical protein PK272_03190 [Methanoregulaceae archaeon]|nr:hypothetical protein [Methanoregulaceae archaeon]